MRIGVDLGGTNIGVGIVDDSGNIVSEMNAHTYSQRPFDEICDDIINLIFKIVEKYNLKISDIQSIGLGVPGVVNPKEGVFKFAPHLMVTNYPLRNKFQEKFDMPIFIDNDAKCAAIAEAKFGATKDFDNSITITIGTGIGAGVIINKKIDRGFHNTAGEIGHMVINMEGEECTCGRRGCWEQYASVSALRRMAKLEAVNNTQSLINVLSQWDREKISGRMVWEAAAKGDKRSQAILNDYIRYISEGVTNIVNVLDTDVIAIGGGISRQGENLTKPIKEFVEKHMICHGREVVEIRAAKFGREAGIIGASYISEFQ